MKTLPRSSPVKNTSLRWYLDLCMNQQPKKISQLLQFQCSGVVGAEPAATLFILQRDNPRDARGKRAMNEAEYSRTCVICVNFSCSSAVQAQTAKERTKALGRASRCYLGTICHPTPTPSIVYSGKSVTYRQLGGPKKAIACPLLRAYCEPPRETCRR